MGRLSWRQFWRVSDVTGLLEVCIGLNSIQKAAEGSLDSKKARWSEAVDQFRFAFFNLIIQSDSSQWHHRRTTSISHSLKIIISFLQGMQSNEWKNEENHSKKNSSRSQQGVFNYLEFIRIRLPTLSRSVDKRWKHFFCAFDELRKLLRMSSSPPWARWNGIGEQWLMECDAICSTWRSIESKIWEKCLLDFANCMLICAVPNSVTESTAEIAVCSNGAWSLQ